MKNSTLTYKGETHPLTNIKFADPVVNAIGHIYSFHVQTSKSGATFLKVERSLMERIEYLTENDDEWEKLGWERSNTEEIEACREALKNLVYMYELFEVDAHNCQSGMTLAIDAFGRTTHINLMAHTCTLTIETIELMVNDFEATILYS